MAHVLLEIVCFITSLLMSIYSYQNRRYKMAIAFGAVCGFSLAFAIVIFGNLT